MASPPFVHVDMDVVAGARALAEYMKASSDEDVACNDWYRYVEKHASAHLDFAHLSILTHVPLAMVAQTCRAQRTQIAALEGRLEMAEQRCKDLEAREPTASGVTYAGVHSEKKSYTPGTLCTRGGGLWLCVKATAPGERPGASVNWKLIVKSGGA